MSLHEEMQHWGSQGSDWWRQQLQTAQIGHARLEAHTAVKTPLPEVLENWVSL